MGVPAAAVDGAGPAGRGLAARPELAAARAAPPRRVAAHDAADPVDPGLPVEAARRAAGLPDPRLIEPMLRLAGRTDLGCATGG